MEEELNAAQGNANEEPAGGQSQGNLGNPLPPISSHETRPQHRQRQKRLRRQRDQKRNPEPRRAALQKSLRNRLSTIFPYKKFLVDIQ